MCFGLCKIKKTLVILGMCKLRDKVLSETVKAANKGNYALHGTELIPYKLKALKAFEATPTSK